MSTDTFQDLVDRQTEPIRQALEQAGHEVRNPSYWDDRPDEWVTAVLASNEGCKSAPDLPTWSFPTSRVRDWYLADAQERPEAEILTILRTFLFENATFNSDEIVLHWLMQESRENFARRLSESEYLKRLLASMGKQRHAHPGVRWALDLLPYAPRKAVNAIEAYLTAHFGVLSDGRIDGLDDSIALIKARWMRLADATSARESLYQLSPREFEALVAATYQKLGFQVELTPPQRDGGRDVVATQAAAGRQQILFVECKLHTNPIGVEIVRQLRGVVGRRGVNGGVLVASSRFTRGAIAEAEEDHRIELVDGLQLVDLLSESFGPEWLANSSRISAPITRKAISVA